MDDTSWIRTRGPGSLSLARNHLDYGAGLHGLRTANNERILRDEYTNSYVQNVALALVVGA